MHNNKLENFVNERREEFDSLSPSPDILNRIQAQMKQAPEKKVFVIGQWSMVMRWAAAAVVIGFVVFKTIDRRSEIRDTSFEISTQANNQPESRNPNLATRIPQPVSRIPNPATRIPEPESRIPNLESRIPQPESRIPDSDYRLSSMVYRLTNMESASDRYAAVSEIMEMKKIDRDIIDVLVKTMNNDPNSNVRLAAMESLGKYYREPYVKKQLVQSMSIQKDPVVQIALIEMLSKFRNTSIANELKKIAEDGNTSKPVKDQAYSSLLKYSL